MSRVKPVAVVFALILIQIASAQTTLHVFAAASLRESFQAMASSFEKRHSGVHVEVSFAGSQQLAAQINQGAPCDVFASADERTLERIAYMPQSRRVFALNRLVVVTPSNDRSVASFGDLSRPRNLVVAAPAVPVGAYTRIALARAGRPFGDGWVGTVMSHIVSQEQDVRSVLAKVELGEADAGIVYVTDALQGGRRVRTVAVPEAIQPRIAYPIAILKASPNGNLARSFLKEVLGPSGQAELTRRGFVSPLAPVAFLELLVDGKPRHISAIGISHMRMTAVKAIGPDKRPHEYRGVLFSSLATGARGKQVELVGGDDHAVTVPLAQLIRSRAVLVTQSSGSLQMVVPGLPPHDWVDGLVRVVVK
ncbi:MAG TPA: molybdate ABC transporter substrate-binding protein [Fimbriimonas sp.]|nr:molybdate ABC transporter substrate-binding protein [Fimbriimonas sp.]